jgi:hypothetical protein
MTMTAYETTRQKLMTLVKSFHAASYPTMEVNYPKKLTTDVEHISDPFITVEVTLRKENVGLKAGHCVRVRGMLLLNHYARENCGDKIFTSYSDTLANYLELRTLDGISFSEVQWYNSSGIPGFEGITHAVNFHTDFFNI